MRRAEAVVRREAAAEAVVKAAAVVLPVEVVKPDPLNPVT
jgi:hypothetical protein